MQASRPINANARHRSRVTRLEGHRRNVARAAAAAAFRFLLNAGLHRKGHGFGRVGRLLGCLAHLVLMLVFVVVAVLVVERLQREPPVGLLPAAAPLGYVRVVLAHGLGFVYLQLRVQPLELRLHETVSTICS